MVDSNIIGLKFQLKTDASRNVYRIDEIKKFKGELYAVRINSIYNNQYIKSSKISDLSVLIEEGRLIILTEDLIEDNWFSKYLYYNAAREIESLKRYVNRIKCETCEKNNNCDLIEDMLNKDCSNYKIDKAKAIEVNNKLHADRKFFVRMNNDKANELFEIERNISDKGTSWNFNSFYEDISKEDMEFILKGYDFSVVPAMEIKNKRTKEILNWDKLNFFNNIDLENKMFFKFDNCNKEIFIYNLDTNEISKIVDLKYLCKVYEINSLDELEYIGKYTIINKDELDNIELSNDCDCLTHDLGERFKLGILGNIADFDMVKYGLKPGSRSGILKYMEEEVHVPHLFEFKSKRVHYYQDNTWKKHELTDTSISGRIKFIYDFFEKNNYYPEVVTDFWKNHIEEKIKIKDIEQVNIKSTNFNLHQKKLNRCKENGIYYLDDYQPYWIYEKGEKFKNPKFQNETGGYILKLKNNDEEGINYYTKILIQVLKQLSNIGEFDVITLVPSSKTGVNSEGLVKVLRKVSGEFPKLKFYEYLRRINTIEKLAHGGNRSIEVHFNSIKLCCDKKLINGKRILLFDDVTTTGNSLKACSEILKSVGGIVGCVALSKTI